MMKTIVSKSKFNGLKMFGQVLQFVKYLTFYIVICMTRVSSWLELRLISTVDLSIKKTYLHIYCVIAY